MLELALHCSTSKGLVINYERHDVRVGALFFPREDLDKERAMTSPKVIYSSLRDWDYRSQKGIDSIHTMLLGPKILALHCCHNFTRSGYQQFPPDLFWLEKGEWGGRWRWCSQNNKMIKYVIFFQPREASLTLSVRYLELSMTTLELCCRTWHG